MANEESVIWKYNVQTLEEDLQVSGVNLRTRMRKLGISKNSSQYGWNTKAEYEEVRKALKADIDAPRKKSESAPKKKAALGKEKSAKNGAAKPGKLKKKAPAADAKPKSATAPKKKLKPSAAPASDAFEAADFPSQSDQQEAA